MNPTAGCVTAVVPHPTNENVLTIGTANGGVWRTDNALSTNVRWKPLTDDQLSLSIGGLALDASDATGNTLVAGFGRRSSLSSMGGAHRGILRTTDGGTTWTRLGEANVNGLAGRSIHQLAVRGATILVAVPSTDNGTATGLYRSTDTGATWANRSGATGSGLPAGSLTYIAADPSNTSRYYAHVGGTGLYRSTDSGSTWTSISAGNAAANAGLVALAVAPNGALFAVEVAPTSRVFRSTNQGAAWTQMDSVTINQNPFYTGSYDGITTDPSNSNLIYLSGLFSRATFPFAGRVVRGDASLAAGSQWTSIASLQDTGTGTAPHTDSRWLAVTAGGRLIEADDGGIYELNIPSVGSEGMGLSGTTPIAWRSLCGDLRVAEMHSLAYDRVTRAFLGGAQDTGFQEQLQPGLPVAGTAGWDKTVNGDGGVAGVDFLLSPGQSVRYGSGQYLGGFFRATYNASNVQVSRVSPALTLSGGGTPIVRPPAATNVPFYAPIGVNAVTGGRLVISGNSNVYESTDGGATVTQIDTGNRINTGRVAFGGTFGGVAAPGVLFYGSGTAVRFRTTASGAVTGSVAPPGDTSGVQGVVFNPANWRQLYFVTANNVFFGNDLAANGAGGISSLTGNLTGVGAFHVVEYLALPSGDAIVVGADLGAFIMRVASPGVWRTLGDNLPRAPVFDLQFDPAGQVLGAAALGRGLFLYDFKPAKATGQWGETFQAYPAVTPTFDPRAGELFSSSFGGATTMAEEPYRELRLTSYVSFGTRGVFRLPDLNPGQPVTAFSAKWNAEVFGAPSGANEMADGMSFTFGPIGSITGTAFTDGTYLTEDGFGVGLTVSVRTYSGNTPGFYVRVNGVVVPGGFVANPIGYWGTYNEQRHFFEVDWRMDTGLTLRVDGTTIFTNLPTPGFLPAAGHRFAWGARTGGLAETVLIDNPVVFTNGVLTPVAGIAPFYSSSDNPPNETADRAFDGNAATKWLGTDYTGFIGASFATPRTVRAYTLTSANDVPGRDPVSWDFQTGADGVLWTQRGAQTAQYFFGRGERRAFAVANPGAHAKFRILMSENGGNPVIQLAEFQPWELTPVSPSFQVANANSAGAGSLRQAIADAAAFPGAATVTFAPGLSGQTIALASEIVVSNPNGVVLDASALTGGLTISGNGASRLFTVNAGSSCTMRGLTLVGGVTTTDGGAISNGGRLLLDRCTLTGNTANRGGAIFSSTTSDFNATQTNLVYCTVSGNTATTVGGGVFNFNGLTTLTHCTVAGNSAPAGFGSGVASYADGFTPTQPRATIIGQNVNSDVDLYSGNGTNSFQSSGTNVIGSGNAVGAFNGTGDVTGAAPLLAPLDYYGGPVRTMALRPGSPARDAAFGTATTADQRGFPIVGTPDIGAYEAGTFTAYLAFIWELLPATATTSAYAGSVDYDGDGETNYEEWIALTNPASPASYLHITSTVRNGNNLEATFPTVVGRNYALEFSYDLSAWSVIGTYAGTGTPVVAAVGPVSGNAQFFLRVRTPPPP